MRHAERPIVRVIGGSIGDQIRLLRQRVNVLFDAVAHDVEVGLGKIDHLLACGILYVRITNVPLAGDRPVKDVCSGGNFVHLQRKMRSDFA